MHGAAAGLDISGRSFSAPPAHVAGVIVWVCFSGPIARALPASWSVPERMAAATLRLDRWSAGARLMASASPQDWARMVAGLQLEQENGPALAACRKAAALAGRSPGCLVTLKPQ